MQPNEAGKEDIGESNVDSVFGKEKRYQKTSGAADKPAIGKLRNN